MERKAHAESEALLALLDPLDLLALTVLLALPDLLALPEPPVRRAQLAPLELPARRGRRATREIPARQVQEARQEHRGLWDRRAFRAQPVRTAPTVKTA